MADTKITALTALTAADPANDVIPIVDVSDTTMAASGTTKKISVNNILGASGTATLASATITGNLTVDTSTLFVNSSNDRVGIGTATPAKRCEINQSANAFSTIGDGEIIRLIGDDGNTIGRITELGFGTGPSGGTFAPVIIGAINTNVTSFGRKDLYFATRPTSADTAPVERYRLASDGVATWVNVGGVAGTAMTLNATGLGVGVSPGVGFDLQQTSPMARVTSTSTTGYSSLSLRNTGASGRSYGITVGGSGTGATAAGNLYITDDTASATRLVIDSSGNLGIGVTPITSHILSCAGPVGISGTSGGTRTSYITNSSSASIYYTDGGGSGYFTDFGNLIIQPRTNAARSVVIATGSTTPVERAVVKSTGQVRFVPLAADPAGAEAGDVYYNSVSNRLKYFNGTAWTLI